MSSLALKRNSMTDSPAADFKQNGFNIEPMAGKAGSYRLEMTGFQAPGWSGRLTAGLAQQQIGIVRGEAEKESASSWRSNFELKSAPFARNPLGIDFVQLASTEVPCVRDAAKITLLDFQMEPCSKHEGSLYIELKGVDRLGLLGDLLDYFSMRCLFPVKMTIETVDDTAIDRFWLRGVGGSVPSESITASIKENLEQLLVPAR